MSARRGQRRTRTAEYDSFSVADDSARPGAELPVNRRSPLSCSKTFESRWFLFATRQPSSPVAQVDALASRPDEGHSSPAQGEEPGCSPAFGDRNAGRPASVGTHSTLDCGYCESLHAMAETSRRPAVLSLSCAMTIRLGLSALRASSRAQFRDRPRDRTPNRSCDVGAAGACDAGQQTCRRSGVRAASAERRRRRSAKALADGSSRFRTEALAGPSSAPKKADDYREDGPAPLRQICRSVGARCRKLHGVNSESSATVAALLYLAI